MDDVSYEPYAEWWTVSLFTVEFDSLRLRREHVYNGSLHKIVTHDNPKLDRGGGDELNPESLVALVLYYPDFAYPVRFQHLGFDCSGQAHGVLFAGRLGIDGLVEVDLVPEKVRLQFYRASLLDTKFLELRL